MHIYCKLTFSTKNEGFMKQILLAICLFSTHMLSAQIFDTKTIFDVEKYRDAETLVIYDLDNTLIEPTQLLGSDQWFYYRFNQLTEKYGNQEQALQKSLSEWIAAQTCSEIKVVEEGTAEMIAKQQQEGVVLMGLSTRDCTMAMVTLLQLNKLNIDLKVTAPYQHDLFFNLGKNVLFQHGVLFTSGCNKGECFRRFQKLVGFSPKRVVFINDKYSNIKDLATACYEDGIEFIGLRYSYLDEKIALFDANIAEIQTSHFGNVLSDEEAYDIFMEKHSIK